MSIDNHPATDLLDKMEQNWPEAVTPVSRMMLRVFRLNKLIRANATRCVADFGLSFSEFQLLMTLRREPSPHRLSPTEICQTLMLSSGGLTKMLYRLEERELISRIASRKDGRSKLVQLTAAGMALIEDAMETVLTSDGELLQLGLSTEEMADLTTLLHKALHGIESHLTRTQVNGET